MNRNAGRCNVRVSGTISDDFLVQEELHLCSVLCPLLFIIVLEALSREIRSGCPKELLYVDELTLKSDMLDSLREALHWRHWSH